MLTPATIEELRDAVHGNERVLPCGGGTKQALYAHTENTVGLNLTGLSGITEYEPDEFTFTALAGTPLRDIEAALAKHGQYLPFDPPFADAGATLGGSVAAGLSGPGRLRFGGIRDFIIGIRFVDGTGKLVHGGGKVVKNAAGFDLPKLMVGSMGRLGAIADLTFKVFPAPRAWRTLRISCQDLSGAIETMTALARQPLDLYALDLDPPETLILRVAGDEPSIDKHADRVGRATRRPFENLSAGDDLTYWRNQRNFEWAPPENVSIKIALTPAKIPELERRLARIGNGGPPVLRRYSIAGNVAWLAVPPEWLSGRFDLDEPGGIVFRGPLPHGVSPCVGSVRHGAGAFAKSIKNVLDPNEKFPPILS